MREIHVSAITDTVAELAVAACCRLPDVMYRAIESSVEREASPSGKDVLRQLLLNADIAASENTLFVRIPALPSCSPKSAGCACRGRFV